MTRHSILRRGLALVLLASLLAGCSNLPTAPEVETNSTGTMRAAPIVSDPDATPITTTEEPVTVAVTGAEASRLINPLIGGTVRAGQFRVIIPPGALRKAATVTVKQADLTRKEVELEVTPATANGFLVPVLLVADCTDMPKSLLSLQTIYWWNPAMSRWDAVAGVQINLLNRSISVPLWHFSKYKVDGKAGW